MLGSSSRRLQGLLCFPRFAVSFSGRLQGFILGHGFEVCSAFLALGLTFGKGSGFAQPFLWGFHLPDDFRVCSAFLALGFHLRDDESLLCLRRFRVSSSG